MEYRVIWQVDLDAESPKEVASEALASTVTNVKCAVPPSLCFLHYIRYCHNFKTDGNSSMSRLEM